MLSPIALLLGLGPATAFQGGFHLPDPAPAPVLAGLGQAEAWVQTLALPAQAERAFSVELFLDGALRQVHLAPVSLRGPHFEVRVQGPEGRWHRAQVAAPRTLRGMVAGLPGSFVAASLVDGELTATVRLDPQANPWGVAPLRSLVQGAAGGQHVVFDTALAVGPEGECHVEAAAPEPPAPADGGSGAKIVEIACDADTQFFSQHGSSVDATVADIEAVLNGVDAIYDADFNIRYEIGTVLVRTSEPDPYTTSGSSALLSEFKTEWLATQGATPRDVAHLFTGKNLTGSTIGVAYSGGLCSTTQGFGLSQSLFSSSMPQRVALTAHELGHNFSADHCNGDGDCNIMCSTLGGCSGVLTTFGSSASTEIGAKALSAACLQGPLPTVPPVLASVDPATSPAVLGAGRIVTGTGFEWTQSVTLAGVPLATPGEFVVLDDTQILLAVADPPDLGPLPLVVTNTAGASAPLDVTFTASDPPLLINGEFALTLDPYAWNFGGEAGDLWLLNVAVGDGSTFPFLGFDFLVGAVGVAQGTLGPAGLGDFAFPIPTSGIGLTFFSQVVTLDGTSGALRGSSNVTSSFVLL